MVDLPSEAQGPAMMALRDDRQRLFAYFMACGEFSASEAATKAGYSDWEGANRVRAHHLMHNPKVLDAIEEAGRKVLRGVAPLAIRAAKEILADKDHPQHARMIETILDRTGFSAKSEHTVKVEHKVDMSELEEFARRLAVENNVDPRKFLGFTAQPVKEIDGEAVEITEGEGS